MRTRGVCRQSRVIERALARAMVAALRSCPKVGLGPAGWEWRTSRVRGPGDVVAMSGKGAFAEKGGRHVALSQGLCWRQQLVLRAWQES